MRQFFQHRHFRRLRQVIVICLMSFFCVLLSYSHDLNLYFQIEGIADPLLQNVKARLNTELTSHHGMLSKEAIQRIYQSNPKNIQLALQPYGYFNPQIKSSLIKKNQGHWLARYIINKGNPVHIKFIDLEITGAGSDVPAFKEFRQNFPLKVGDIFLSKQYENAKDRLFTIANHHGFLTATLTTSEVRVDLDSNTAIIILHFETGPQFYYGKISFNKTPFATRFLQRFLKIKTGDPYSPNKLLLLQQDYTNSGYFASALVNPVEIKKNQYSIPVQINLIPYPSQQYLIGGGFGTDTGVRGTLGINFRRVTSTGQQFKTIVQAAQKVKNINLLSQYIIPGANPLTDQFIISGGVETNKPQNFTSIVKKVGFSYITNKKHWQSTLGVMVQRDHNDGVDRVVVDKRTHILYPFFNVLYVNADDPVFSNNGLRLNFSILGGSNHIASSTSFFQVQFGGKSVMTFAPTKTRLLLRGNLGYTGTHHITKLPLSMRFFTGGANSIRGYGFQDLGPGTAEIVGSAEVQQNIFGNWYLGAFYDVGNALNTFKKFNNLKRAAGIGVMFATPVGPIELSIARPLHDPTINDHKWRIQFTMGPDL